MLPIKIHLNASLKQHRILPKDFQKKLENSSIFSICEKINLISLLINKKWVTELDIGLSNKDAYVKELDNLSLPWRVNHYKSPPTSWIQVGANQAVLDYVFERGSDLSELEAGVLYGYPITHALGFMGIIDDFVKPKKNIAEFYLSGVFSAEFKDDESQYFDAVWAEICQTSPKVAKQALEHFKKTVK